MSDPDAYFQIGPDEKPLLRLTGWPATLVISSITVIAAVIAGWLLAWIYTFIFGK